MPGIPFGPRGEPRPPTEPEKPKRKPDRELVLDLEYVARTYGLDPPYDFELASSILSTHLIMRGTRREEK